MLCPKCNQGMTTIVGTGSHCYNCGYTIPYAPSSSKTDLPQIDKGIPIPPPKFKHQNNLKYGLDRLEVGDSITILGITQRSFTGTKKWHEEKYHRKLATRVIDGGIRVWRVK